MADASEPKTIGDALKHARTVLQQADIDGFDVEARLLSEWATGFDRLAFITQAASGLSADAWATLLDALAKRLSGMPVHRIMGSRAFYGMDLKLSPDTLEPRPDTEALVDLVLEFLRPRAREPLTILDLGTGTGAIGLALASHLPKARATLTDISAVALETALGNAEANGLRARVDGLLSDWFVSVTGKYDVIVSNPPYIRSSDIASLDREVREHDPLHALDGGPDGLEPYRVIARDGVRHLRPGGLVAVEFGFDQAVAVNAIFAAYGWQKGILRKDLGGRDRALLFSGRKV